MIMQQKINDKNTALGITKSHKLLLAISGGIDSMFLCDILLKNNYNFALCHCNFTLRSDESDQDEDFVRAWAEKNNLPIFVARFNTKEYAKKQKISIQEAARELRYDFFAQTAAKNLTISYVLQELKVWQVFPKKTQILFVLF
jgi:tRNA(Ile)-lysidine synthase